MDANELAVGRELGFMPQNQAKQKKRLSKEFLH
jgi:hypothetical protein